MDLADHVGRTIATRGLLRDGARTLVAVSGGADSMVLLDVLHRLAPRHGWLLAVAHFNHRLRGRASDADEALVRRTAKKLKLPCLVAQWNAPDRDRIIRRHGLEMAARLARHAFLVEAAQTHQAAAVILAHHADDQVELFFLRLFRGAGGEGLGGMKWSAPGWLAPEPRLVRPLLDVPKAELIAWARRRHIAFRGDASNADLRHERNRIRHELLPLLARRFGPGIVGNVWRTMELTDADAGCVRELAARWLVNKQRGAFGKLSVAIQRQCVKLQLEQLGIPTTSELIEQLRSFPGKKFSAGTGRFAARKANGSVTLTESSASGFDPGETSVVFAKPRGALAFDGVAVEWTIRRKTPADRHPIRQQGRELFDAARAGTRARLRHWRAGDRFQPIGLSCAAKLQDLFTNAKIPTARRRAALVAETATGEIFWVEGLRIGECAKVTERTRRILEWCWARPG